MSCVSPGAQASSASGPPPRLQSRASESSRPRIRLLAKCSWLISSVPCSQASPTLCERWEDHVAQDGFQPERGEAFVEDRVHGCFVVAFDRGEQTRRGVFEQALGGLAALERGACGLGG